MFGKFF